MKKLRQATVETVLSTLINFMGIGRIWTRGLVIANKFMLGAAIAYNLKKWLTYTEKKRKTAVIKMKEGPMKALFRFSNLWLYVQQYNTKIMSPFMAY